MTTDIPLCSEVVALLHGRVNLSDLTHAALYTIMESAAGITFILLYIL